MLDTLSYHMIGLQEKATWHCCVQMEIFWSASSSCITQKKMTPTVCF